MSDAAQEEQLFELLLLLKKSSPDQARAILNAQPPITYALLNIMIKLNVINVDVFQQTLASFAAPAQSAAPVQVAQPQPAPPPSVPAHLMQGHFRNDTPPVQPPAFAPPPQSYQQSVPYSNGHQSAPPAADPLSGMSEEQKAMIMRVVAMTPDQIARLPPNERATIIQLRGTLGLPT